MRQAIVSFIAGTERFVNSNGVDLTSRENRYGAGLTFAAKEGTNVSSFNGIGFALSDLSRPLHQCATADVLMRQATEQVHTKRIPAAFKGDLLITPDCLGDFISFLTQNIASAALIAGNSIYLDKLGEQVAADGLTMHSPSFNTASSKATCWTSMVPTRRACRVPGAAAVVMSWRPAASLSTN
jgi:PmbA protein